MRAIQGLTKAGLVPQGKRLEYVILGNKDLFDTEYRKHLQEKLRKLNQDDPSKRIRNVRKWAIQELLSQEMTLSKLQKLAKEYEDKVASESSYNVGNHEPLIIFKEALENVSKE